MSNIKVNVRGNELEVEYEHNAACYDGRYELEHVDICSASLLHPDTGLPLYDITGFASDNFMREVQFEVLEKHEEIAKESWLDSKLDAEQRALESAVDGSMQ